MADIKQAAKWLREGKTVRRSLYGDEFWVVPYEPRRLSYEVVCADGSEHPLDLLDILAEDWEDVG